MRRLFVGVAMLALGCAHGGGGDYGQAAVAILAIAEAASVTALNVASGNCATTCVYGTYCDEHGMCKAFPCHDSCRSNEECVMQPIEHCEQIHPGMQIQRAPEEAPDQSPPPPPPAPPAPAVPHDLPSDAPRK